MIAGLLLFSLKMPPPNCPSALLFVNTQFAMVKPDDDFRWIAPPVSSLTGAAGASPFVRVSASSRPAVNPTPAKILPSAWASMVTSAGSPVSPRTVTPDSRTRSYSR